MNPIVSQHLEELFLKASRGTARKAIYALRARQSGDPAMATLYEAMSQSEAAQARRLLIQLRGQTGSSEENQQTCFAEEVPALINDYSAAAVQAEEHGERAMHSAFSQSERVGRIFLSLQRKLEKRQATEPACFQVCRFCGFIREGVEAPEECPICTAPSSRFQAVGTAG